MSLGHNSPSPMGLGDGSGVVLTMASGFSASTFPKDNTGTAGTYFCLKLWGVCAATPDLWGSSWGWWRLCLAVTWGGVKAACACTSRPWRSVSPARAQGWAALPPVLSFTLPKTPVLSTFCLRNPGFLVSLLLFEADLREQWGSVTRCQVRWLISITGEVQMLADKSLQGLMM